MSRNTSSSPVTPKRAYRYSIAHFDYHPNSLPPSRLPIPIRRWTGKWHTTPNAADLCCCCDSPANFCNCHHHDDTFPLFHAPAVPASASKTHVKSAFPEYELEELETSRASTDGVGFENVRYSSPVSSATHSVRFEREDDVWSTIAIASVKGRDDGEGGNEVGEDGGKRRLTIEKIEERGSIAKKQKIRKQGLSSSLLSGDAVPSKTKRFFNSIKHVFRPKSKKSSPLAIIDLSSNNESPDEDIQDTQPEEESSETVVQSGQFVAHTSGNPTICAIDKTGLTTSPCPSPLTTIHENDSLRGEDKENVLPILTSPVLPITTTTVESDTWQDKDIVVKRSSPPPPTYDPKDMEIVVGPLLRRNRNTAAFEATVYFQNEGHMERGCVVEMEY